MPMDSTNRSRLRLGVAGLMLAAIVAAGAPAAGQSPPAAEPDAVEELLRARGEAYHRAADEEQDPAELRTTRALNDEIASRNALAGNQESADRETFDAAQARYEQDMAAADADRVRYEADMRAAEDARLRYERALADWGATVRACEIGDRTRCAAGSMSPRTPYDD